MSTGKSQSDQLYTDRMPYVFGSSTPREFSYMNHVPQQYRIYDAKFRRSRRTRDEMTLSDYLRQIRSSSPLKHRDRSVDSARIYVFGSSTPRRWTHLEKIPVEYRIYDVSLNERRKKKRSKTTSFSPTDYGASNQKQLYGLKSYSSLGVSQSGHNSELSSQHRNDSDNSKKSERTRSVPRSASSSRHNGASSVDSQKSSKSGRSSSSHRIASSKINANYDRNLSNQTSVEKNPSVITTPNEELVLVVTETVGNMVPNSILNGNHEQTISVEHDDSHNVALVHQLQKNPSSELIEDSALVRTIERSLPQTTIHVTTSENLMQNENTGHESDDGDKNSESDMESSRSNKTVRPVSAVNRSSFDIPNDAHHELSDEDQMHNDSFIDKKHADEVVLNDIIKNTSHHNKNENHLENVNKVESSRRDSSLHADDEDHDDN